MTTQYEVHPAAAAFPMMALEDINALAADIQKNGQRIPIQTVDGVIVDGRNRLEACRRANVEPTFAEVTPPPADIVAYVIGMNIERRHLTTKQRAAIAADLANMKKGGNRKSKGPNDPVIEEKVTLEDAAKKMKVSRKSVVRAKKVKETNPEEHEKAKKGEAKRKAPVKKAKKEAKATADDYAYDIAGALDRVASTDMKGAFNQANKKDLTAPARKALLASLTKAQAMIEKQIAAFTVAA